MKKLVSECVFVSVSVLKVDVHNFALIISVYFKVPCIDDFLFVRIYELFLIFTKMKEKAGIGC